tara:strand:+ start:120712 stop:121455 length:744 start_codon:yes stop_codon:yes gene_type:complete
VNILFKIFAPLWSPKTCYRFIEVIKPFVMLLAALGLGYGMVGGLFLSPADYQQGDCFRIIYIHVPFAILSVFLYSAMGILSLIFLIWRIKIADMLAYSIAPMGALFTFLALVTGAIWGKPMWGTWWIWDARLTSELILLFLYLGYIALYKALLTSKKSKIAPAILSVVGLVDLPIIHYSVYWWNTLHQGATITKFAKPSMDSSMLYPLLAMLLGMVALAVWIVGNRLQAEILQHSEQQTWLKQEVYV